MANAATVPGLPRPFGKYRLVRHLARGGMGDVFLATLEGVLGFEQTLVIKTILPELSGNPRFVEMFAAEAKTAVLLSHGNIVPIYELGEHDGVLYIAMAYIDGAPLSDLVSAARRAGALLPHGPALHIVRQILEGMAYAHTGDRSRPPLVHRDLSPRNILVERSGQIRIVDFGIAMFAHVTEGARMGSAGYAAPEQQRAAAPDPRADVFSIGALLYELLTLEPAFSRAGVYAPPDLSDIPGDVRPVIERALALDPERRYPDAGAFLEALAPVLARHAATTTNREVARVAEALVFRRRPTETPATTAIEPLETPATAATPTAVTAATRTFATRLPPTPVSSPPEPPAPDGAKEAPRLRPVPWIAAAAAVLVAVFLGATHLPSREPDPPTGAAEAPRVSRETPAPKSHASPRADAPGSRPSDESRTSPHPPSAGARPAADPSPSPPSKAASAPAVGVAPSRPSDARGRLSIVAPQVSWAEAYVDGRKVGHTPLLRRPVPAGQHRVRVVCRPPVCPEERTLLDRTVRVPPGRTVEVRPR